ncbi:ABC transporter permease [Zavarzinia aquatilis]|uniref:Mannose-1-phosphate guanyltransferase n=1 Tax=Zavarzinia aquatilis TaxID=2211142 RepID=A0A317DY48_9PROT|nr:ABC transporter permease [Zavarzinia aquatilis]PWR19401.1 mannose-1-phosphate guanyltransferase [Zavarzinia aquatilis]
MSGRGLSLARLGAMVVKEFIQMRRDRVTFALLIGIPIIQLTLFGFAINNDPKGLPTIVHEAESGPHGRSILSALRNSGYFDLTGEATSRAEVDRALELGRVQFAITIPVGFERALLRGESPQILIEADASDPSATGNAIAALSRITTDALAHDAGDLPVATTAPPFGLTVHRRFNPDGITQYNIVPGLIGVILTMTMVITTAMAMTRERERGTMENLLAMPVRPIEVMAGKIVPPIGMGAIQVGVVLLAARALFGVPMTGSFPALMLAVMLFIATNLCIGFTFSTVARNQLQAMQMSFFFFLPSILLSGFMFPFRGMPGWAQVIGEALPLTHFLRVVRGVMLRGNGFPEVAVNAWPMLAVLAVVTFVALNRYKQTLD